MAEAAMLFTQTNDAVSFSSMHMMLYFTCCVSTPPPLTHISIVWTPDVPDAGNSELGSV